MRLLLKPSFKEPDEPSEEDDENDGEFEDFVASDASGEDAPKARKNRGGGSFPQKASVGEGKPESSRKRKTAEDEAEAQPYAEYETDPDLRGRLEQVLEKLNALHRRCNWEILTTIVQPLILTTWGIDKVVEHLCKFNTWKKRHVELSKAFEIETGLRTSLVKM